MIDNRATDTIIRETRAARRLGRLFKFERGGAFDRRPAATVRRLLERRAAIVTELLFLDRMRRSLPAPNSAALEEALRELASEVQRSRQHFEIRIGRLDADLRLFGGGGSPTGIRDSAAGCLLGQG